MFPEHALARGKSPQSVAGDGKWIANGRAICTGQIDAAQTNGPRCSYGIAGPWFFVLAKRCLAYSQFMFRISMARGLCAFDPAVMFKLSAAQRGVSSCSTLTLRRDLAKQGRMSEPVASCSSPRVGRRTLSAFLPAVR